MSFSENKLERSIRSCSLLEFLAILKNSPLIKPEKVAGGCVEVGVIYMKVSHGLVYIFTSRVPVSLNLSPLKI